MGFGIFMGIVPLWGFQLLIAIALSIVLKLNKALVIIAANISIPPMIPLILFLSHYTGKIGMGDKAVDLSFNRQINFETFQNSLIQYILGAILLAIVAGLFFGLMTYVVLRVLKVRARS